jgi:hypothetical protein
LLLPLPVLLPVPQQARWWFLVMVLLRVPVLLLVLLVGLLLVRVLLVRVLGQRAHLLLVG